MLAKLASRTRIEPLVDRFTQELRNGKGNASSAAKELYEAVLVPIKEWRTARRLLVVPDGRLHLLPFDALLTQNAIVGPPVVSTVPSANVFVQLRSGQPAARPERALLGVGGVPYDRMFAAGKPAGIGASAPELQRFATQVTSREPPSSILEVE